MGCHGWITAVAVAVAAQAAAGEDRPLLLSLLQDYETVYAPPEPPQEGVGFNEGAVNTDLSVTYVTDNVFRGIERFDEVGDSEDAANVQISGALSWDLGKLPHPFIGLFVNVFEDDPVSNFQELRPVVGFEWNLRPLIFSAGNTGYQFPDRDALETAEVWGRLEWDDSALFDADRPVFSPYVFAAYDYDLFEGWYLEAGIDRSFHFDEINVVLTLHGHVSYVEGIELFAAGEDLSGFQHYQVGLTGAYSLNNLLNVSRRYGEWSLIGFINYTDNIEDEMLADTQLWGGGGIGFQY